MSKNRKPKKNRTPQRRPTAPEKMYTRFLITRINEPRISFVVDHPASEKQAVLDNLMPALHGDHPGANIVAYHYTEAQLAEHNRRADRTPELQSERLVIAPDKRTSQDRAIKIDKNGRPLKEVYPTLRIESVPKPLGENQFLVTRTISGVPRPAQAVYPKIWAAQHVAQSIAESTTFYRSAYGAITEVVFMQQSNLAHFVGRDSNSMNYQRRAQHKAEFFADPERISILAEPDFAQLLHAAAITAPHDPIHADELIRRNGMLVFTETRNMQPVTKTDQPVRAISWESIPALGKSGLSITIYTDKAAFIEAEDALMTPLTLDQLSGDIPESAQRPDPYLIPLFQPIEFLTTYLEGDPAEDTDLPHLPNRDYETPDEANVDEGYWRLVGLIRSIKAIAESQHTHVRDVDPLPKKKKKQRQAAAQGEPAPVKVLSLISSEVGQYELDAATGRKLRAHWVRGHWRKQWYPSMQDHRTIWIDGFVKGNPDLGTVPDRPTVYIARTSTPPRPDALPFN